MIRKDTTLDADRPHYYSQFWIDIAMGKREIGGPRTATADHETESIEDMRAEPLVADVMNAIAAEPDFEPEPEPPIVRTPPAKKPEPKRQETPRPSLSSLADLAKIDMLMRDSAQMGDDTVPDIENAAAAPIEEEAVVTNFDPAAAELDATEEPVESLDAQVAGEDFEDEEEEDEWGGGGPRRGSKPNKRRQPRRDF